MQIRLLLSLILLSSCAFGQSIKSEIDAIYNFSPGKLTRAEQEKRLPRIDQFWGKVKNDTPSFLQPLRDELGAPNHSPFFYYDGAGLLLSLSESLSDKDIAVKAIAKCDLNDIDRRIYVSTLNKLANEGINVTSAALKILSDPKFSFFLPEHAMDFNQGYCLTYMLLPEDPSLYVDSLVSLFRTASENSQLSIITTLWFAYSCQGDSLLKSTMTNKQATKKVREYARTLMGFTDLSKDQKEFAGSLSKEQLEQLRAGSLKRFSDEAIEELDLTTRVLRKGNGCR